MSIYTLEIKLILRKRTFYGLVYKLRNAKRDDLATIYDFAWEKSNKIRGKGDKNPNSSIT